jgi:hypothetical protein
MQEVDAERRIQILRGQRPPTPPLFVSSARDKVESPRDKRHGEDKGRNRKRRRLAGEDDTDRDIRFAKEDAALAEAKREELLTSTRKSGREAEESPMVDSAGHINFFTPEMTRSQRAEKNAEAEADTAKKKREYEDQYTMRFSNASGFKESAGQKPWYSSAARELGTLESMPQKDVWGNEDPMRKRREEARIDASDPLASIKKGVQQLKEVERERKRWKAEKMKEFETLKAAQEKEAIRRQRSRRSRPRSLQSVDGLNGFKLDAAASQKGNLEQNADHHHRHRHDESSYEHLKHDHHFQSHLSPRRHRYKEDHLHKHDHFNHFSNSDNDTLVKDRRT